MFRLAVILAVGLRVAQCALPSGTNVLWDGRVPFSMTEADIDASTGPYLTVVKGQNESASYYTTLLGHKIPPTPLHNLPLLPSEQALSVSIDNTSVFLPGGSTPQYGFRRTDLIAQINGSNSGADPILEPAGGTTTFHFSIQADVAHPLNYTHEYQIVFIEPSDGTHIFEVQLGSPFTDPTGPLPAPNAHWFKVRDHALNVLFQTPFLPLTWHNFAVTVGWAGSTPGSNNTLAVAYSVDGLPLQTVAPTTPNPTVTAAEALGDFHIAVIKLPLVNPADTPSEQSDVVHYGIQEGTHEALLYSGVFVTKD
ncbi:hypothetical protein HMN09_01104900 [Mycena chlorophos]|uniref:Glycoside hydrolase 131 catalytic N-terminal domain-containing protein n=1 Tax=Mycena chlorophos TaxID=658473 RepID=A0A8H6SCF2_MYCCL|nr:hypothetical protein HMN09_01104900 [Mycena chlorophos]